VGAGEEASAIAGVAEDGLGHGGDAAFSLGAGDVEGAAAQVGVIEAGQERDDGGEVRAVFEAAGAFEVGEGEEVAEGVRVVHGGGWDSGDGWSGLLAPVF